MSGIRGKNTKPELVLRKALHAAGFRYRLHVKNLPGKPDLVFPKYKAVIFVHGCFWHGHDCRYFKLPASNREFWSAKIRANRKRDEQDKERLTEAGWRVLIVWECALRGSKDAPTRDQALDLVQSWLLNNMSYVEITEQGIKERHVYRPAQ